MKKFLLLSGAFLLALPALMANSINTVGINGSPFCAGSQVSVLFDYSGSFTGNNVFVVQLSDASGSFSNPVTIANDSSGTSPAAAIIPFNTAAGSGYRIRVVSTSPVTTGTDNGNDLTILAAPSAPSITSTGHGCVNIDSLSLSGLGTDSVIVWNVNGYQAAVFTAYQSTIIAGGNGYGAAANQLASPNDFCFDSQGNLYVADFNNNRVQKFPPGSTSLTSGITVAGGNGSGAAGNQLYNPASVFVDTAGNLFVSDFSNNRIQKFPPGSTSATNGITVAGGNGAGVGARQLSNPAGIFLDILGNLYVSDFNNNRIQKFQAGSSSITAGVTIAGGNSAGAGATQLSEPVDICFDASGNMYVADFGNNRIQKFPEGSTSSTAAVTAAGSILTGGTAANQLYLPYALDVDSLGNLYVADYGNNRIQMFPAGSNSATNGITLASGNLQSPSAVIVDSAGNLYIANALIGTIEKWSPGPTPTSYKPETSGVYNAQILSSQGCASAPSNNITYDVLPSFSVASNPIGCDSVVVDVTVYGNATVIWSRGNVLTPTSASFYSSGTFSFILTDSVGCSTNSFADSVAVLPQPAPPVIIAGTNSCLGQDTLQLSGADSAAQIVWLANNALANLESKTQVVAGGNTSISVPASVFVAGNGDIYVADANNNRVMRYPANSTDSVNGTVVAGGNGIGSGANQFSGAAMVVLDSAGNIYVADQNNNRIQKFPAGSNSATPGITVAGGNGPGSALNQINSANALCLDRDGNIYVADGTNSRIIKFPVNSTSSTQGVIVAGGNDTGSEANQLNQPAGLCVDATGNLYVADFYNNRIQYFPAGSTSATNGVTVAGGNGQGNAANQLNGADGVWLDATDNLYIADYANNRVLKFPVGSTSATPGVTIAGGNGAGSSANQLNGPIMAFIDEAYNIYVADGNNNRVQKFPPGSTSATNGVTVARAANPATQIGGPNNVWLDTNGDMYVSDFVNSRIQKFPAGSTSDSAGITVAGGNGAGNLSVQLSNPVFACIGPDGNLYVADYGNNRVQKFPAGSTSATAGVTVAGGHGAGTAATQLDGPVCAVFDATGNMYVSDAINNRVQKFPSGSTTNTSGVTVAGNGIYGSAANQFAGLGNIFVDGSGNILAADQGNSRVQKFPSGSNSSTAGVTVAGGNGSGNALNQLANPWGVFADSAGNLYISDPNNNRVQRFPAGSSSATNGATIVGGPIRGGETYQLSYPIGIYVSGNGDVYVADNSNNRIIKCEPAALITSYVPTNLAGTYTASMVSPQGCPSGPSNQVVINNCTGIQEPQVKDITVYPNPASSYCYISGLDNLNIKHISLINVMGQTAFTQVPGTVGSIQQISVSNITQGLYFLIVDTEQGIFKKPMVVAR